MSSLCRFCINNPDCVYRDTVAIPCKFFMEIKEESYREEEAYVEEE